MQREKYFKIGFDHFAGPLQVQYGTGSAGASGELQLQ
jgi:hypothetical protein